MRFNIVIFYLLIVFYGQYIIAQDKIGVNVDLPTVELDIDGEVRFRSLSNSQLTNVLARDKEGKLHKVDLVHLILEHLQTIKVPTIAAVYHMDKDMEMDKNKLYAIKLNKEIVLNKQCLSYDENTAVFTVNEAGVYTITLQAGPSSGVYENVIGLVDGKTKKWLGRSSWNQVNHDRTYNVFTITLKLAKGDKFYPGVIVSVPKQLIGIETGTTGNGSMTNITITKF
ncbi:hypothetical protein [Myroides injenensis]|uniref:hypothetical protein n=1 Tax=Myroides injenensis TaxID=1183151 RepID=UPI000289314C|nr:hypothetical protein [Myroides injenensis]